MPKKCEQEKLRRPLIVPTLALLLGIALTEKMSVRGLLGTTALVIICGFASFLGAKYLVKYENLPHQLKQGAVLFVPFFLIGGSLLVLNTFIPTDLEQYFGENVQLTGIVKSIQLKDDYQKIQLQLVSCNSIECNDKVLLSVYQADNFSCENGWRISANCKISEPSGERNPGCFDYKKYLRSRRITALASANASQVTIMGMDGSLSSQISNLLWRLKDGFLQKMALTMDAENLGLLSAMLFGDKSALDEDVYASFQKNGTAHILAVSGLHIGMIYGLLCAVLGRPRSMVTNIVVAIMLIMYAALAEFSPSVLRAVIMIMLHIVSKILHKRYDLISSACLTMVLLLLFNPYRLYDLGFRLSFLAIFTLGALLPLFKNLPIPAIINQSILPVALIQIGMAPYTAYAFNYFSWSAFLANVPIIFLAGLVVPAGVLLIPIVSLMPWISGLAGRFMDISISGIKQVNEIFCFGGNAATDVTSPPIEILFLFYGAMFVFTSDMSRVWIIRKKKQLLLGALAAIIALSFVFSRNSVTEYAKSQITLVDVGQGTCLHLKTPRGRNILIDGGGKDDYNVGEKTLKPYLLHNGVKKIDLALATHMDTDHYKGIEELNDLGMVEKVITNENGLMAGDVIASEDDFKITVLSPAVSMSAEGGNEMSLVLRVDYAEFSVIATGDIGSETETDLIERWHGTGMLDVDILVVAHHGSKYSTCDDWIRATSPKLAIIPVGKNNYGHPSSEVIERLASSSIPIYRTDLNGAIGIRSTKDRFAINTEGGM